MLQPRIPLSLALALQVQGHYPYFWRGAFLSWLQNSFCGTKEMFPASSSSLLLLCPAVQPCILMP